MSTCIWQFPVLLEAFPCLRSLLGSVEKPDLEASQLPTFAETPSRWGRLFPGSPHFVSEPSRKKDCGELAQQSASLRQMVHALKMLKM